MKIIVGKQPAPIYSPYCYHQGFLCVFLDIHQDHLDRYKTLENYAKSKKQAYPIV